MQINQSTINALQQAISLNSTKLKTEGLTVGQQILARVVSATSQGNVTLHINNTILNARSTLPLTQGQALQLIVAQTGAEILLVPTQKAIEKAVINNAMRQTLPLEKPLKEVMENIQRTIRPNTPQSTPLPATVTNAVRRFIQNLPSSKELMTGDGLKKTLREAGTFLENNLRQIATGKGSGSISKDLKGMLLQLKEQIREATGTQKTSNATTPAQSSTTKPNPAATTTEQPQTLSSKQTNLTGNIKPQSFNSNVDTSRPANPTPTIKPTTPPPQVTQTSSKQALPTEELETNSNATKTSGQLKGNTPPTKDPAQMSKAEAAATENKTHTLKNTTVAAPPATPRPKAQARTTGVVQRVVNATTPLPDSTTDTADETKQAADIEHAKLHYGSGKREAALPRGHIEALAQKETSSLNQSLLHNVQEKIGELFRQIDSALARTQLHQLNTLNDMENGKLAWSLELPIRNDEDDIDVLKMRIYGDEENKNEEGLTPLTVTLEVDLKYIGPVFSKIVLLKDKVSVGFWAEEETTVSLFDQHLEALQHRLQDSGLRTDKIACHHGPAPNTHDPIPQQSGLLDLKA